MRAIIALTIAAGLLSTLVATSPAEAASPALALKYKFGNFSRDIVHDSSLNELHGTLVNTTRSEAKVRGLQGRGWALNLVGAEQQFVAVPEDDALDVNRFTLTALVRYTGVTNDESRGRWEVMEKAGAYWINIRENGKVRVGGFFGACADPSGFRYLDSAETVPVDTWTHVAARYNGSALTVWINGTKSASLAVNGRTCSNDEPLAIGAKNAPAKGILDAFWDGQLDDVRIYNRAISARRIAALVPSSLNAP